MEINYFNREFAIEVHDGIILNSGGLLGVINLGLLDSALGHIRDDFYYPSMESKVTHLFYSINKNHSFKDGNKRSAIALSAYFLKINGYAPKIIDRFILETENLTVDVADNRVDKELLYEVVISLLYEDDFSEELKLKIYKAKNVI